MPKTKRDTIRYSRTFVKPWHEIDSRGSEAGFSAVVLRWTLWRFRRHITQINSPLFVFCTLVAFPLLIIAMALFDLFPVDVVWTWIIEEAER